MTDYYVEPAVGNDSNAGTAWGAGNSWATIQKAYDTATAGDTCYCKGTETLTASVDIDTNFGTIANGFIKFIGVNDSGNNDGTQYAIDGDSQTYYTPKIGGSPTTAMLWHENITFRYSSGNGFDGNNKSSMEGYVFINCHAHNNALHGFDLYGATYGSVMIKCLAYSNTYHGFEHPAPMFFCVSRDNTADGSDMEYTYRQTTGCIFFDNGDDGFSKLEEAYLFNCVIDGNTDDGVLIKTGAGQYPTHFYGTRFTNHSGTGDIALNASSAHFLTGWCYWEDNDTNISGGTQHEILEAGVGTDDEDNADTNEGYTDTGDPEDWNLRSDATLRRTAIQLPMGQ